MLRAPDLLRKDDGKVCSSLSSAATYTHCCHYRDQYANYNTIRQETEHSFIMHLPECPAMMLLIPSDRVNCALSVALLAVAGEPSYPSDMLRNS